MTRKEISLLFEEPQKQFRPEVRWWLAEGLNTDETLRRNIDLIDDYGFGGAEIIAMPEEGADDSVYGWGSEEWASDIRLIAGRATEKGLGFSLTSGTHWSCANLPDTYVWDGKRISPDHKAASKELDYTYFVLKAGEEFDSVLPQVPHVDSVDDDHHGTDGSYTENEFAGVVTAKLLKDRYNCGKSVGYSDCIGMGKLDFATLEDHSSEVIDGRFRWKAPSDGGYAVFVFAMHGTAQTARPSVSTNYALNYVDKYGIQALKDYWDEKFFDLELRETVSENDRAEMYMDSLELLSYGDGGILWGHDFKTEFEKRRGYDISKYLPLLLMNRARVTSSRPNIHDWECPGFENEVGKIRNDYNATLSELYVDNVLKPLQQWLHSKKMRLRAEPSYGLNYEISTPAKALDDVEVETYAQVGDPDLYRGLSGSANVFNRVFSSETGAVPGRNYYYNMETWTDVCFVQFACGVSRIVFHGYSAIEGSEENTYWPGHEGMFARYSERFGERQPASIHYPLWTKMLSRIQKAMRLGTPLRDVAILRTDYSFINYGQPTGHNTFEDNYSMFGIPTIFNDLKLQNAGYTYDYFSSLLLLGEDVKVQDLSYKAYVIYQEMLEYECALKILELAMQGVRFVFVDNNDEIKVYRMPREHNGKAASRSASLKYSDEQLQEVVDRIKALANVRTVGRPCRLLTALESLGVKPRIAFGDSNNRLLTCSRFDKERSLVYTFVDYFKFSTEKHKAEFSTKLVFENPGKIYEVDVYSGKTSQASSDRVLDVSLLPGECKLIVQDLADSGAFVEKTKRVYGDSIVIDRADITIEDWDEGEKVVNIENKFGHETREAWFTTRKTLLAFEDSALVPWNRLKCDGVDMKYSSGVGTYVMTFENADGWTNAILKADSICGGTARVWVNGVDAGLLSHKRLECDISDCLHEGANSVKVEVTSTLTNRMIQRGYKDMGSDWTKEVSSIQDYGLVGSVRIIPYCE